MALSAADAKRREHLVRKRGITKGKITSFINLLDELEINPDIHVLKAHMSRLEIAFANLDEITSDLQDLEPAVDHYAEQSSMENDYINILARCYRLQDQVANTTAATANAASSIRASPSPFTTGSMLTRLPEQSLPKFSGKCEDWLSFQDDFQSSIGRRPGLSDTERLKYLRSCLSGEPERLARQFETTDEGYRSAWALLKRMFEDKGKIRERHIHEIFNVPDLQGDSAQELSQLINTVELHCSSLKSLGENTFSKMMLCFVLGKLDKSVRKLWRMSLKENDLPTYDDLINFLRRTVITSDEPLNTLSNGNSDGKGKVQRRSDNSQSARGPRQNHTFVTTTSQECPLCKEIHQLFQCKEFKKFPPKEKFNAATRISACINCLRTGHTSKQCPSNFTCKTCNKKHHTWLHFPESPKPSDQTNGTTESQSTQA